MYLAHYGIKRRSGRYPYGSGKRPYQSLSPMEKKGVVKKQELSKELLDVTLNKRQAKTKNRDDNQPLNLPKGTNVQHITGTEFGKLRKGQLYVTATDYDNALYEAFLSMNLSKKGWNPSKVTLTLSEDLKVPSSSKQKETFSKMFDQNKNGIIKDLRSWLESKGKDTSSLNDAQNDVGKIYDMFMNSIEKPSRSQKLFYKRLKEQGYNGVLDEHDISGSWMQGRKPIVLMDALNTIGDIKISEISKKDMLNALNKYLKMNE